MISPQNWTYSRWLKNTSFEIRLADSRGTEGWCISQIQIFHFIYFFNHTRHIDGYHGQEQELKRKCAHTIKKNSQNPMKNQCKTFRKPGELLIKATLKDDKSESLNDGVNLCSKLFLLPHFSSKEATKLVVVLLLVCYKT